MDVEVVVYGFVGVFGRAEGEDHESGALSYFKIVLSVWTGFFFIFNNFLYIFKFGFQFIFRIIYLKKK